MENYMKLQIPATGENEGFARNVVAAFALKCSPTVGEVNDVKTAVSEAVTNAVVHAYDGGDGVIDIEAEVKDSLLTVIVRDRGKGIDDVKAAREPFYTTKPEDERSGMGFTVIETFMDGLDVVSTPGFGTTVTMTKKFGVC